MRAEQNDTIMETKKQLPSPPFVTPDVCPPDMKNGGYLTFTSDDGSTTYAQVTNDLNIWFKTISKEGFVANITTYNGEAAKKLIDYFKFRERQVKEGREIDNNILLPSVELLEPNRTTKKRTSGRRK